MHSTVESANDVATPAAIGLRLKMRRIELGLTLAEAAKRTGMNETQLSRLEHGRGDPRVSTISRALSGLDMTLHDLTGGKDVVAHDAREDIPNLLIDWKALDV